jgi:uncharacterized protein involved in exopolysaccharide biosynthesis
MSIIQFLTILWARRFLVFAATFSCLLGAVVLVMILPPRWQAHSRAMLDLIKPDPVTGQIISGASAHAYAATQMELIRDYRVAGLVADQLGWLSNPELIQEYQHRPKSDVRDFRRWLAQLVIDRTKTELVEGSNILEITYTANRPGDAKAVADALMKAYVDTSLAFRRSEAARNADWFEAEAQKAKLALDQADAAKTAYERANNIVLQDDKVDVDSARLHALASQAATPMVVAPAAGLTPSSGELAQLDAMITQQSQVLGPNHPELKALQAKRAAVAAQVAQERASSRAAASGTGAGMQALNQAVAAQRARVMQQSDKVERLRQLQADVNIRRDQYEKTAGRAAELRQEATVAQTGITVLGAAATPQKPSFPNMPLIIFGSGVLGLAIGVLSALLAELLHRRVRGLEDLQSLANAPLLGAIAPMPETLAARRRLAPWSRKERSALKSAWA